MFDRLKKIFKRAGEKIVDEVTDEIVTKVEKGVDKQTNKIIGLFKDEQQQETDEVLRDIRTLLKNQVIVIENDEKKGITKPIFFFDKDDE